MFTNLSIYFTSVTPRDSLYSSSFFQIHLFITNGYITIAIMLRIFFRRRWRAVTRAGRWTRWCCRTWSPSRTARTCTRGLLRGSTCTDCFLKVKTPGLRVRAVPWKYTNILKSRKQSAVHTFSRVSDIFLWSSWNFRVFKVGPRLEIVHNDEPFLA